MLLLSTMPRGFRDNPSVSFEIMVWNRVDNKPSSASVMTHCRMLLCITREYCVNDISKHFILISNLLSRQINNSSQGLWNIEACNCFCNKTRCTYFSDTTALLQLEPQCPLSTTSLINSNGPEVSEVLDSDPATCLPLDINVGKWMRISVPHTRIMGQFVVSLMGNLKCSPMFGLSVATISVCGSDICSYSRCIAKDWVTSNGMGGCKYRCHSFNVCDYIIVDIAGRSGTTITGTLCEIDF